MSTSAPALPSDLLRAICPGVMEGFGASRRAIANAGPLDTQTIELIMLGAFATMGYEAAVKIHAKRLLDMHVTKAAVQQAILVTFGATTTVAECSRALQWIEQVTSTDSE